MTEIEIVKGMIRMVEELLLKQPYQNDGMRKQLEELNNKLKELSDGI